MNEGTALAHHTATVNNVRLHYVVSGQGEPVVLLHGWAQTWHEWRHIIPLLAPHHTVIVPDLRGMGDSGRPETGYDKRTVAEDIHQLVRKLGHDRVFVVGHDIGLAVAYAYATAYPDEVRGLALMELMLPGFGMEAALNFTRTTGRWHIAFHMKSELAEMLIAGKEREYLSWFYRTFAYNPVAITEQDVDEYVRCYSAPGAMRASLEHYRALFDDADYNREAGKTKLRMPVLALGGAANMGDRVLEMMRPLANQVTGGSIPNAGHWIPEEQPELLAQELLLFMRKVSSTDAVQ